MSRSSRVKTDVGRAAETRLTVRTQGVRGKTLVNLIGRDGTYGHEVEAVVLAASCDCGAPMLSVGWTGVAAGAVVVGSAVAAVWSGRAAARHRDQEPEVADPRSDGDERESSERQPGGVESQAPNPRRPARPGRQRLHAFNR